MRQSAKVSLLMVVLGASVVLAQHAPLPETLVAAHRVYLVNDSGDLKAYNAFYQDVTKSGRLQSVTAEDAADVVAVLTTSATYSFTVATGSKVTTGGVTTGTASAVTVPGDYLYLKIFDARTGEVLWSDSTEKWITGAGHAPGKLVDNLKQRFQTTRNRRRHTTFSRPLLPYRLSTVVDGRESQS